MRATEPDTICDSLQIRDTAAHNPSTDATEMEYVDVHEWLGFALKVANGLNQDVTLSVYGHFTRSITGAQAYADTLAVTAGTSGIITYHGARTANWTPWIYASLVCGTGPTTGSVTVEIVKFSKMED